MPYTVTYRRLEWLEHCEKGQSIIGGYMFYTDSEMRAMLAGKSLCAIFLGVFIFCAYSLIASPNFLAAILIAALVAAYEAIIYCQAASSGFDV